MAGPAGAPEGGVGMWGQLVAAEKAWGQILSLAAAMFSPTALLFPLQAAAGERHPSPLLLPCF